MLIFSVLFVQSGVLFVKMGNDSSKSSYSNILTLGIEESGKTTFVNNLISVYHPFVHEFFITEDFLNFFALTNCIVNHILKDENLSFKDKTSTENIKLLKQLKKGENIDETSVGVKKVVSMFLELWTDDTMMEVLKNKSFVGYSENCEKLILDTLQNLVEFEFPGNENYSFYQKMTGTSQVIFLHENILYRLVGDVKGDSHTRKFWNRYFELSDTYIYMISLSDFDEITEDGNISMKESLECFTTTLNEIMEVVNPSMVVVFNKKDELEKKLAKSDLSKVFPEYNGGNNVNEAENFITNLFKQKVNKRMKKVKFLTGSVTNIDFVKEIFKNIHYFKSKRSSTSTPNSPRF
jgi:hypothetical protein